MRSSNVSPFFCYQSMQQNTVVLFCLPTYTTIFNIFPIYPNQAAGVKHSHCLLLLVLKWILVTYFCIKSTLFCFIAPTESNQLMRYLRPTWLKSSRAWDTRVHYQVGLEHWNTLLVSLIEHCYIYTFTFFYSYLYIIELSQIKLTSLITFLL